jgi:hypothetical protein
MLFIIIATAVRVIPRLDLKLKSFRREIVAFTFVHVTDVLSPDTARHHKAARLVLQAARHQVANSPRLQDRGGLCAHFIAPVVSRRTT